MDKVGILIISKCLSSAAMVDAFMRSETYSPEFYVVEKQVNPFNAERAKFHHVVADLNLAAIASFVKRHRSDIAFGLTDTEDFVTAGGRDFIEREAGVPMICVAGRYAVERSKADQRLLFDDILPGANPRYRIFDPRERRTRSSIVADLRRLLSEFGGLVIKPDAPARGAGVGVWGSDFSTEDEMTAFFLNVYSKGRVVVEERVEGEESSFHAFSDGRHFVPAPLTRDYKRALEGNRGRLTGGMGSYRDSEPFLPFMAPSDWEAVVREEERAFMRWKGRGSNPGLRGIVLYDALMHTGRGFKILERNSRGGNTEQVNLLATMQDDFVDVCYRMVEGDLRQVRFSGEASVVTCAVPAEYGTPGAGAAGVRERVIGLGPAYDLQRVHRDRLRVFPMDVTLRNGSTLLGTSRAVAVVGVGPSIEEARMISREGTAALDGPLRSRDDIASREDIEQSLDHLVALKHGSSPPAR